MRISTADGDGGGVELSEEHVEPKACMAGQRGPSGGLAEAGRSLGQAEARSGAQSSF